MISSTASVYLPWAISLLRRLFSASSITRHSVSVRYRYLFVALTSFDLLWVHCRARLSRNRMYRWKCLEYVCPLPGLYHFDWVRYEHSYQIWNRRLIQCVDLLFRYFMPGIAWCHRAFETRAFHLNERKHNIWIKVSSFCRRTTIYCAFLSLIHGESLNYDSIR